jgi:hypothetical protein
MAQAGALSDVTQRLFVELKSKNEEARARAAYELYENVLSVSRGMVQFPGLTTLTFKLTDIAIQIGLTRNSLSFTTRLANVSPNSS